MAAMARRDPAGLDGAYRRYSDRLYAYARSLIGDSHAAADVVHDTFLLASQNVRQLRDPNRLPQWLYAIARHEGLRQLRRQARQAPLEAAGEPAEDTVDLVAGIRSAEVAEVVRAAMAGLSTGDREMAELAIRHRMSASEIAAVIDEPVKNVHARLSRARDQLQVSLGALLVARHHDGSCGQLGELITGWAGELSPLLRKRIHRHIEECEGCSRVRRERVNPAALLSAYAALPFLAAPRLRPTGDVAALEPPRWSRSDGFPRARRRTLIGATAGVLIVLLIVGGTALAMPDVTSQPAQAPIATLAPIMVSSAPSPSLLPSPTPSPTPTASPSTKPSTAGPPPALAFTATATAVCVTSPIVTFTVTVNANATLATAKATVAGPIGVQNLTVNGKNAQKSFTDAASVEISWQVEIKAADGRTKVGPMQSTHNTCFP